VLFVSFVVKKKRENHEAHEEEIRLVAADRPSLFVCGRPRPSAVDSFAFSAARPPFFPACPA